MCGTHLGCAARKAAPQASASLISCGLLSNSAQYRQDSLHTLVSARVPELVVQPEQSMCRSSLFSHPTIIMSGDGCFNNGLGSPLGEPKDTRSLVPGGTFTSHQCKRTESSMSGLSGLLRSPGRQDSIGLNRQYASSVLYNQIEWSSLHSPVPGSSQAMGLLHCSFNTPRSILSPLSSEHLG